MNNESGRVNRRFADDPLMRFRLVACWLFSIFSAFGVGAAMAARTLDQTYQVLVQMGTAIGVVGGVFWALYWGGTRASVENLQTVVSSQDQVIEELRRQMSDLKTSMEHSNQINATEIRDLRWQYDAVVKLNIQLQSQIPQQSN